MPRKSTKASLPEKAGSDRPEQAAQFSSDSAAVPIDQRVGNAVRKKRQALGLTLADVASGAHMSSAMLSRIENGQSAASLDVLDRLCAALGISIATLMAEMDQPEGAAQLIKSAEQMEVVRTGTKFGHNYKLLSYQRGPKQPFEPFLIEMDRESENYPRFQHPGIEFIYMLSGRMNYCFGGRTYLIESGDAFTFSGQVEHGPAELLTDKVKFISIIYHEV